MNTSPLKRKFLFLAILMTCLSIFTTGCTSGVSQEEYDQLKFELSQVTEELNQTKEELAKAQGELQEMQSIWQSLNPQVQIAVLLLENQKDTNLRRAGEITDEEYIARADKTWAMIEANLNKIGNKELTEKFTAAWFEPIDTKEKYQLWADAAELYMAPIYLALEDIAEKYEEQ